MNTQLIQSICYKLSSALDSIDLRQPESYDTINHIHYTDKDLPLFINDLITKGREYNLTIMSSYVEADKLRILVEDAEFPVLYFEKTGTEITPMLGGKNLKGEKLDYSFDTWETVSKSSHPVINPFLWEGTSDQARNGKAVYLTAFPMKSLVSPEEKSIDTELTPVQRLFRLFGNERKDIGFIYLYAIVIGLISLSLPLGIQAIINLISGGMVFSSVYLLLFVVIGGVLISGIMQIIQITLVEVLQQRIFAKAAFEFTYRIPRVKTESLLGYYPPELMNRFFDILTVQKALPKILIDITGAFLQILFGIMLLSFYHPFFIAFGFLTLFVIALIVYVNGPKGLETSLVESKYKYKVAQWLEDIARSLYTFKLAAAANLPMEKMDGLVNNYLVYRKKHFKILRIFFWNAVVFKTLVIGGLLILGTFLVVDRQISLGQFVATEIIIVLLTNSVEKLIQSIDTIFDSLTAVEKLGTVTDMPLESEQGFRFSPSINAKGMYLEVSDLKYKYYDKNKFALNGVSFTLNPTDSLCITGSNGSGKNTLLRVLSGMLTGYQGSILFNGISLKDLNVVSLRSYIEQNSTIDDIFEGSILQNITMGREEISLSDLNWVLTAMNLNEEIGKLPDGLNSQMLPGGRRYSESFITKVTLARCLVSRPKILMLDDSIQNLHVKEKNRIISLITDKNNPWSLLFLSNDPAVMKACDRVMVLNEGEVVMIDTYDKIKDLPILDEQLKEVKA